MARLCHEADKHCWFDLALLLAWEQFRADAAEFVRKNPLASSSEGLERDILRIEKVPFPELAATPYPEMLLEGRLVENIGSALLYTSRKRGISCLACFPTSCSAER